VATFSSAFVGLSLVSITISAVIVDRAFAIAMAVHVTSIGTLPTSSKHFLSSEAHWVFLVEVAWVATVVARVYFHCVYNFRGVCT